MYFFQELKKNTYLIKFPILSLETLNIFIVVNTHILLFRSNRKELRRWKTHIMLLLFSFKNKNKNPIDVKFSHQFFSVNSSNIFQIVKISSRQIYLFTHLRKCMYTCVFLLYFLYIHFHLIRSPSLECTRKIAENFTVFLF